MFAGKLGAQSDLLMSSALHAWYGAASTKLKHTHKSNKCVTIQENDYYLRILIRSAHTHTPHPLALGTFNENPCAKPHREWRPPRPPYEKTRHNKQKS